MGGAAERGARRERREGGLAKEHVQHGDETWDYCAARPPAMDRSALAGTPAHASHSGWWRPTARLAGLVAQALPVRQPPSLIPPLPKPSCQRAALALVDRSKGHKAARPHGLGPSRKVLKKQKAHLHGLLLCSVAAAPQAAGEAGRQAPPAAGRHGRGRAHPRII